ncbi:MAG: type II secretion system protein M [Bdellovibrionales bacterium]|nr:type II secretion system protein M [Bdellovibrionales bacterium]
MLKKVRTSYLALSARERLLVTVAGVSLALTGMYLGVESLQEHIAETRRLVTVRSRNLEELAGVLRRHQTLSARLGKLQTTFAEAQLTFEQVTKQLDTIVRESIGSDNYDLKVGRSPEQVGFEYEKQEFTLRVKSLSLEQVVKLLHRLEQGESPLFLGKADLVKENDRQFGATLEIFSIRKS